MRLTITEVQAILFVLHVLAIATMYWLMRRLVSTRAAWVSAMTWAAVLSTGNDVSTPWNPSLAPLPLVLATACIALVGMTDRKKYAVLAGLWIGVLLNLHVAFVALIPSALLMVLTRRRHPWLSTLLVVAGIVVPPWLISRGALAEDVRILWQRPVWVGIGAAVLALAAFWLRRLWSLRDQEQRLVAAAICIASTAFAASGVYIAWTHAVAARVLLPGCVAGAALLGLAAERLFRARGLWVEVSSLAIALLFAASQRLPQERYWALGDVTRVGPTAIAAAPWGDLFGRLQGPACWELTGALAVLAPPPTGKPSDDTPRAFRLLRVSSETKLPAAERIPLDTDHVAVFQVRPSRLLWAAATVCIATDKGQTCKPATMAPSERVSRDAFLFERRAYPALYEPVRSPLYEIDYEIVVLPGDHGHDWHLDIVGGGERGDWMIAETDIPHEGELPARSVRFHDRAGSGRIHLRARFGKNESGHVDRFFPPCVLETDPEEDVWRRAAREASGR